MTQKKDRRKQGQSAVLTVDDNGASDNGGGMVLGSKRDISKADSETQLKLLLKALEAVRGGDFSIRLPIIQDGVFGEITEVFNDVVALNEGLANEVTRASKVIGEEGNLCILTLDEWDVLKNKIINKEI